MGEPAHTSHSGVRHITGVNPVRPPFFGSINSHVLKEAKRTILDYEERVKNHNLVHALDNKPLQVMFMLKKGLVRALIEEALMPGTTYDSTDTTQLACIRAYFFQTPGTTGVDTHIKIDEFERGMREIRMDTRDTSWLSRTTSFLSKVTLLLEDTRVQLDSKN